MFNSRLDTWIRIVSDPHASLRGFSILNLEFKSDVRFPVQGEMKDFRGNYMHGMFWVVAEEEVFRVCPRLKTLGVTGKPWFFPREFCNAFVRPYYFRRTKLFDLGDLK